MHAGEIDTRGRRPGEDAPYAPCPRCGYDLRGHAVPTCCPECGSAVDVSASMGSASRWADERLLDLWSIGVLQMSGGVMLIVSVLATYRGHYLAVLLGMVSGLCVAVATIWYVAMAPGTLLQLRRPTVRALRRDRVNLVWRWFLFDGALVGIFPVSLVLLAKL